MPFKVIDGDGPGKEERDRKQDQKRARDEFSWAIRDCAANLLRIIRGAGKPHELMRQMQLALNTSAKFYEVHGYWPQEVIVNDLRIDDEAAKWSAKAREGTLDQDSVDRWHDDGTFDRMAAEHGIFCGALQIIASEMIGQSTQKAGGSREFHDGLREYERVREAELAKRRREERTTRPRSKRPKVKKKTRSVEGI
ncbi:hypothetical protein IVB44_21390 [Bradyrhizobium sp. 49]|uniref:hypothetical protein n=1 Tax=unclassified Bradyrhizobium TaxID=2631580 RepID=UPI001FF8B5A1|nr:MULTISPECIES: hypothetical protein [unclassified Bradyrhizobium]MCK1266758.1 hypothetical protein [Bradyrhizobium sp. 84]MCK1373523.1 hypothetical protein [Bradyrhizobium sp. 49]